MATEIPDRSIQAELVFQQINIKFSKLQAAEALEITKRLGNFVKGNI